MQSISSPENMSALAEENWETAKMATIAQLSASMDIASAVARSTRNPVAAAVSQFAPLSVINRPKRVRFKRNVANSAQATNT